MDYSKFGFREDYNPENKIVKQEYITFGGNEYLVSTVDLGLNHRFGEGEPLYYETMIFPKNEWGDMYCNRYTDRETALKEHEKLVEDIKNGKYVIIENYFEKIEEEK